MAWKKILFSGSSGELSSLAVDGNITGVFQGALSSSAQIADDISGSLSAAAIVALGANILSGSQHEGMNLSGSFSGSYIGDGSGLTNIDISQVATVKADFSNATSVNVDHNFDSRNVQVSVYNDSNVQIIPASVTLSTVNRAVVAFDSSTSGHIVVSKGGHIVSGSVSADNISGLDAKLVNLGFASTGSNTFTANQNFGGHLLPSVDETYDLGSPSKKWRDLHLSGSSIFLGDAKLSVQGGALQILESGSDDIAASNLSGSFTGSFIGDGSGLTGVVAEGTISSSAQIATDISGSGNVRFEALNAATSSYALKSGQGIVSASVLSSPSQGTVRLATNGVNTDVDLGLQTNDNVTFANLVLTGDLEVRGTQTTISSSTLDIGDNIIALNGTGAALGGMHVNDANGLASGSLLWDGTANKWIAGASGSEVTVALLEGQGLLSGSATQVRTYINVEDGADVTDATNVTAAGALMDSEVTSLALIKALTAAQISGSGNIRFEALNTKTGSLQSEIDALEAVNFSAGTGLTGGGTLASNRTFNVASANNGIVANADNIELATASSTFTDGVKAKLSAEGVISSSAQIDGDFLNTTGDNVLSGSAQIAADISGSLSAAAIVALGANIVSGSASQVRTFLNVEDNADVTDATNVTAAGALMDSELAEIATVKALTAAGISGSFVSASNALGVRIDNISTDFDDISNKPTLISSSAEGDAQGQVKLNGVNVNINALGTNDSPSFTNLTVNGDLTVTGNTFEAQVTNLNVEDKFILVNSGSASGDSGIVFGGSDGSNANQGNAIFWDNDTDVFGFAADLASNATSATVTSKLGNIETHADTDPSSAPTFQGKGSIYINESSENIFIYS